MFVSLTGCARMVRSYVTPFYQQPLPVGSGKTFFVCPLDQGNMNNPEFFHYAGMVGKELERHGFKLAGTNRTERADFIVLLGYGISGGTPMTYSVPVFGQTGGGVTRHTGTFTANTLSFSSGNRYSTSGSFSGHSYSAPQFGQVDTEIETVREYDRFAVIAIADWKATTADRLPIVYVNRVKSTGTGGEIAAVMPKIIAAMFSDFPGTSGKTRRVVK